MQAVILLSVRHPKLSVGTLFSLTAQFLLFANRSSPLPPPRPLPTSISLPTFRLRLTRMFCLDCALLLDENGNLHRPCLPPPPRPSRKRARDNSSAVSAGCNCVFALASLTKYTFKLLSMCAPETLRPLSVHNIQALCADDFCSVIFPNLHEVERIVLRRIFKTTSETGSGSCSSCSSSFASSSNSPTNSSVID